MKHHSRKARIIPVGKKGHEAMKTTILLMIDEDREENLTVTAFSKELANIYITAATMEKAQALLTTGRQQAEEAMASWTPEQEEEPHPDRCPYHPCLPQGQHRQEQDFSFRFHRKQV